MKHSGWKLRAPIVWLACLAGATGADVAGQTTQRKDASSTREGVREFLQDLLPTAWQKRPFLHYNVITEMTPEGRKRRVPTTEAPMRYFSSPGKFVQTGWMPAAGEKPPPAADLEVTLRQALASNGYLPVENDRQRPELLIIFTFGSTGTDPAALAADGEADRLPTMADELVTFVLRDPTLFRDVVERARFVAGDRYALELKAALEAESSNANFNRTAQRAPGVATLSLPVSPEGGSPFEIFLSHGEGSMTQRLAELAFHTCYFVVATAYDFQGVENRRKIPLWQTRMTVEAQGVAMTEVLPPLIANAGAFLGRETPASVMIDKRLNREGHVEIGTPTVVNETKPPARLEQEKRR